MKFGQRSYGPKTSGSEGLDVVSANVRQAIRCYHIGIAFMLLAICMAWLQWGWKAAVFTWALAALHGANGLKLAHSSAAVLNAIALVSRRGP